jgi:hypothetical protein
VLSASLAAEGKGRQETAAHIEFTINVDSPQKCEYWGRLGVLEQYEAPFPVWENTLNKGDNDPCLGSCLYHILQQPLYQYVIFVPT